MSRAGRGVAAVATAAALVAISAAPGSAAAPVAQASASAISLTVGGKAVDASSYRVTHDGTRETATGSNQPPVTVLAGQSLITTGTLAQDATTSVVGSRGRSAACSGLAGQGATVVGVGTGNSCLVPGQAVTIGAGSLDLSQLQIVQSSFLQGFDAQTQAALQPIIGPLTAALQSGLQQAVGALGLDVAVELGAVQSSCVAEPGVATGTARLAGAKAYVQVGGQRVSLLDLPVDPAPNTRVVADLGDVAVLVQNAIRTQLSAVLGNLPGGVVLPPIVDQAAALNAALASLGTQLEPLQQNVIDAVLNKQTKASPDQIEVTALDLNLLPVAQQAGVTVFNLEVGTSACGPTGTLAAPEPTPTATPTPTRKAPPPVPTSVPAGLGAPAAAPAPADGGSGWSGLLALADLALAGAGAAGIAVRRASATRP